jgi:hypothetical protein
MRRYEFENADDANAIRNAASVQECTLPIAEKYNRGLCAIPGFLEEIMSKPSSGGSTESAGPSSHSFSVWITALALRTLVIEKRPSVCK